MQAASFCEQWYFLYQYSAADAYPNTLVTYEIVCGTGNSSTALPLLKGFLTYLVSSAAQSSFTSEGYVALPTSIQTTDASVINSLS